MPGVGKLEYEAGKPDFKVHYDAAKVSPEKIAAACEAAGHGAKVVK
jgi:hypothetical protein